MVRVDPDRAAEITALYAPVPGRDLGALADWSPAERAALTEYLVGVSAALEEEIVRARATVRGGFIGDTFVAPLAGATTGRLVFASGAPRFALAAAALGQQARVVVESSASRLTFDGVSPARRAHPGAVRRAVARSPSGRRAGHDPLSTPPAGRQGRARRRWP